MLIQLKSKLLEFFDEISTLHINPVLIGGLAIGFWVLERTTKDIDFTIALNEKSWPVLKKYLEDSPHIKIQGVFFDSGSQVPYLIRFQYKEAPIDLLVSLTDYQDSLLSRSVEGEILGKKIPIASAEDIINCRSWAGHG